MKSYKKPVLNVEYFTPNEFVANNCGEGTTYLFECNAPGGTLYYYPNSDGKIDGVHNGSGKSKRLGGYGPCNEKHMAQSTGDFYDGFVDYNRNGEYDNGEGVIVWLERGWLGGIRDYHATKKLNMDSWEIARS